MGFGGGGSAGMTAHVHNNVPLQGGPLDFANDTIASLSAGSVTYSDGAALQELVKPAVPAGEVLTFPAAATAPSWQAAGGVSLTQHVVNLGSSFSSSSSSFVDITGLTLTASGNSGAIWTTVNLVWEQNGTGTFSYQFMDAGSAVGGFQSVYHDIVDEPSSNSASYLTTPATQIIKIQGKADSGNTFTIHASAASTWSTLQALEIG
jgi:hypothetical protein